MAKATHPPARRTRLEPILAAYQPRRRSSRPACLICRESWVYSLHRPVGAEAGRAVGSCSRRIQAPACWVAAGFQKPPEPFRAAIGLGPGGSSWSEAAEQPAGDLGGTLLLAHAGVEDQHRAGQGRDEFLWLRGGTPLAHAGTL